MTGVILDLLTIYKQNSNLFDDFALPEGLDRNTLIDNLLMETMECSIIYNNPVVLQNMIGIWSRRRVGNWWELYKTLEYRYNPIENYDRQEEWIDRIDHEGSSNTVDKYNNHGDYGGNNTRTPDLTEKTDGSTTSDNNRTETNDSTVDTTGNQVTDRNENNTTQHDVWGFNESAPAPAWKDTTNGTVKETINTTGHSQTDGGSKVTEHGTGKNNVTVKNTGTEKDVWTENRTDTHGGSNDSQDAHIDFSAHKGRVHGNIGVTTTQKMIQEQRDIVQFNLFDTIISEFKQEFCLLVW